MTYIEQRIEQLEAEIAALRARVDALEGMTPDLLSVLEAAELIGVHENTIKQWIRNGKLPATKPGSRNWKIARADVLAIIEAKP